MAIIEVHHITKEFRLGEMQSFKQSGLNVVARMMGRPVSHRALFKALDDVNFHVDEGEVLGIIGQNGAGKSTLLKILSNITKPTSGRTSVRGSIAPLIEVGAGLVPELTGRENIFLNASILGVRRREIRRSFDRIVSFSELEEFIDTPVKRYSTGMKVRLGFSVATSIDAEILIVDEVLAVGDLAFQRKCFDRMEQLIKQQGRTVLMVSHNIRQVERLCTRTILLDRGRIVADGLPRPVCDKFYERSDEKISSNQETSSRASRLVTGGDVELLDIRFTSTDGVPANQIEYDAAVRVSIVYKVNQQLRAPVFGLGVHTTDFLYLATNQSIDELRIPTLEPGVYEITCYIKRFPFLPGVYSLRLGVALGDSATPVFYAENVKHFQVTSAHLNRAWASHEKEGFVAFDADWHCERVESDVAS